MKCLEFRDGLQPTLASPVPTRIVPMNAIDAIPVVEFVVIGAGAAVGESLRRLYLPSTDSGGCARVHVREVCPVTTDADMNSCGHAVIAPHLKAPFCEIGVIVRI